MIKFDGKITDGGRRRKAGGWCDMKTRSQQIARENGGLRRRWRTKIHTEPKITFFNLGAWDPGKFGANQGSVILVVFQTCMRLLIGTSAAAISFRRGPDPVQGLSEMIASAD